MDLSRRDAFRPCSRDSSGDKVNFVLSAKKKKTSFNWNRPPSPFLGYINFMCNMAAPKLFAYDLPTSITQ